MVKKNKHFLLLSACAAFLSLSIKGVYSNGDVPTECAKIVVADFEKLMRLLPEFTTTEEDFKNYITSQRELQKKQIEDFKKKVDEFRKVEKTLPPEEKKIRQENLDRDEAELQRGAMELQRKIEERSADGVERLKEILEKNYVDPYAKNNKIDIVLNYDSVNKVYNKKFDITDDLAASIKKNNNKVTSSAAKK